MRNLASDFPAPDLAQWRALAERGLKGEPFDRLISPVAGGLSIQPLYVAEAGSPTLAARKTPAADFQRPWDLRSIIDHPSPAEANARALQDLEGGAASLLLRLDPTGQTGVAAGSLDDLQVLLDGVLLELAPVALDAGLMGPQAANWLATLAKGAPNAPLAFHLDPLSAFAISGSSPGPIAAHVAAAASAGARHAHAYPKASLFLASGRAAHEAGGSAVTELAMMAAAAAAYLRALDEAGIAPPDALPRLVLGLTTDADVFVSLAKVRAARQIWASLASACGSNAPAVIEVRSSNRMLSKIDAWTNLLRLTAAGFAGGAGGADVVALDPFTRPLGAPDPLARRQTRNIQLVLMEEAHAGRVADPAGGSWFVEQLTCDLATAAWSLFQTIERKGGLTTALESGVLADHIAPEREALLAAVADGASPMIGVNAFAAPDLAAPSVEAVQPHATTPPHIAQTGPDSACPPLAPIRLSATFEEAAQ